MAKQKLVVVGNGMAGMKCIEELLKLDPDLYDITVFGGEPHPNYNRIMLSKVLQGDSSFDNIIIHPWDWYEANGIRLYAGKPVTRIHPAERYVEAEGGVRAPYDKLILATGSAAFVPQLSGVKKPGVTVFRNMEDCRTMVEASDKYRRAAVIGGGLLGLEAAKGLLYLGMEVHVVHNAPYLMNRQLDRTAAELLRKELERQGMRFLLGKRTERITGRGRAQGLLFSDGTKHAADLIVLAVGIRPRIELAEGTGIRTNHAFVVDDFMRTNLPDVYAVGECAEHRGIVYGLVAPLYEQGKVLARTLCGMAAEPYRGSVPSAQLKIAGIDVFSAGTIYGEDEETAFQQYDGVKGTYKKVTMRDGRITGALLYGDSGESTELLALLKRGAPASALGRERKPEDGDGAAAAMAGSETVCSCNGVCKSVIVDAVRGGGLETVEQVRDRTKASGSCGGCRPLVQAIIRHALDSPGSDSDREPAVCGCTDLGHEALKSAIAHQPGPEAVLRMAIGLKPEGCPVCRSSTRYYAELLHGPAWQPAGGGGVGSPSLPASAEELPQCTVRSSYAADEGEPGAGWLSSRLEAGLASLPMPAPVNVAVSGGSRHPAGVPVSGFGLAGTPAGWELHAGGHGELPLRQSRLIALEADAVRALELALCAVQLYRETAYFGEQTWQWLERLGLVNVRERLLDPAIREALLMRWEERRGGRLPAGIAAL